jgi:hypothetical protein
MEFTTTNQLKTRKPNRIQQVSSENGQPHSHEHSSHSSMTNSASRRPRLQMIFFTFCVAQADTKDLFFLLRLSASFLLSCFHGVHDSYNVETDSVEVVGISNCPDRSDTVS